MIELKNITKVYDHTILDKVTLNLFPNNIYLLKGISGSGKTTLLNIISGIDDDFDGEYLYNKKDVKKFSKKDKNLFSSRIGYIFQKSLLISHLNVFDNLLFINNDKEKIYELSEQFGVSKLLKKMPFELSGGERQRIAIIRTLLLDPQIIIADEPTSSLDSENAIEFVKYMEMLRKDNRIIIITSHTNVFDDIADSIINIDYGKTTVDNKNENILSDDFIVSSKKSKDSKNQLIMDIKYSVNRNLKIIKFLPVFFLTFIILLIFLAISLKQNFKTEYTNYLKREYPFNTIFVYNNTYRLLENNVKMKKYDNYSYVKDNVEYLPLLPKDETILSKENYIEEGRFPENEFEVLVNNEYVKSILNRDNLYPNDVIIIDNIEFKIVGVISNLETHLNDIYSTNIYYNLTYSPQVFIPYDSIKNIVKVPIESEIVMITFDNLNLGDEWYELIISMGNQNCWDDKLSSFSFALDEFLNIFFVSLGATACITIIFIANQILIDLFYRKNEIGYLQLFGVNKRRLKRILLFEYAFKYILSLLLAIFVYYAITIFVHEYFLLDFRMSISYLLLIIGSILIYCYIMTFIPLKIFLRKSIKVLISK